MYLNGFPKSLSRFNTFSMVLDVHCGTFRCWYVALASTESTACANTSFACESVKRGAEAQGEGRASKGRGGGGGGGMERAPP